MIFIIRNLSSGVIDQMLIAITDSIYYFKIEFFNKNWLFDHFKIWYFKFYFKTDDMMNRSLPQ